MGQNQGCGLMRKGMKHLAAAKTLLATGLLVPAMTMAQEPPAAAQTAVAAASRACGEASSIVYRPPNDLIVLAAKRLRAQGKHYQRDFDIVVTVGEDGLVREVQIAHSSGHLLLDLAVRNWARGQMYAPMECGPADSYRIRLPLKVDVDS